MNSTLTFSRVNMNQLQPYYNPVSLKEPNETDKKIDQTLSVYMDENMKIASDEEMRRRDAILAEVKHIFVKFVQTVAVNDMKLSEEEAEDCGGDIYISGSHRLGIRDIGADIDAVCIAPNFCTREHFFTILKQDFLSHSDVTDLIAIEGAIVPILSFDFRKVSIDLLFARLADNIVPKNLNILDNRILSGLDLGSEKSLNGPRVTNMIPELVGKKSLGNFRIVLRLIRRWAKNRGIYGNKLGYLGGINVNLLTALVMQLYPNASPSVLLSRFFHLYSEWQWPKPVKLNQIQSNPPGEDREVWNERDNLHHVMPIITPAYPAMNSTANVSLHSLEVMKREFKIGREVMKEIIRDRGQNWDRLFAPSDFFVIYSQYLCLHIVGTGDDEVSRSWIGFVESRLRHLTSNKYLGTLPLLKPIHLYPVVSKTQKSSNSICYFIGFNIDPKCKALHMEDAISRFTESLYDPERGWKGQRKEGIEFYIEHYPWKRLPPEVFIPLGGKVAAKVLRQNILEPTKADESNNVDTTNIISSNDTASLNDKPSTAVNDGGKSENSLDDSTTVATATVSTDDLNGKSETLKSENGNSLESESIIDNLTVESLMDTKVQSTSVQRKRKLSEDLGLVDSKVSFVPSNGTNAPRQIPKLFSNKKPYLTNRKFTVPNIVWINLDSKSS